jgi:uncharacterized protein (TIGR03435 family)
MVARPILAVAALVLAPIALGFTLFIVAAPAQTTDPTAHVFHPIPPLPSYEVATIKPSDPAPAPNGMRRSPGVIIREYIRGAYSPAAGALPPPQVVGGPPWIDKDRFQIVGKPPADLEVSMRQMNDGDRLQQTHAMQQSLLVDRFHLKVHFEVREMSVYTLVPAKGGLKIKEVAAPAPPDPGGQTSPPPSAKKQPNAGAIQLLFGSGGTLIMRAHAISMAQFAGIVGSFINLTGSTGSISLAGGDRPVLDQTGFTGNFDLTDFKWSSPQPANSDTPSDTPSLENALQETLGLRLVSTKGHVEVVVIDSIDHPSEN